MFELGLLGEQIAVSDVPGAHFTPVSTPLANGGYMVVWNNSSPTGSLPPVGRIMGQIIDAQGNQVGNDFVISNAAIGSRGLPSIVTLANGNVVVAWSELGGLVGFAIAAQIFDPAGNEIGSEFILPSSPVQIIPHIQLTALSGGGFAASIGAISPGNLAPPPSTRVDVRVYDNNGVPATAVIPVALQQATSNLKHWITSLSDGGFLVTWDTGNLGTDGDGSTVLGQRFDAAGVAQGAAFILNNVATGNQGSVRATGLANGGFVATWTTGDTTQDGDGGALKARLFDANGQPLGPEFLVNTTAPGTQVLSETTALADGGFVAVWATFLSSTPGPTPASPPINVYGEVYAQRFAADGTPVGTELLISDGTTGGGFFPTVITLASGDIAFTWTNQDFVNVPPTSSVVASRVFSLADPNDPPVIISGQGDTASYSIAENGLAVAIVTATDADGDAITYSITGGADAALFTINAQTGALSFIAAPDFETPADAGGNNAYDLIVTASDGAASDSQAISVTVTNVREGVVITGTNADNRVDATRTVNGQLGPTEREDLILGLGGADRLSGLGGNDEIDGGSGDDRLTGGLGADLLTGGTGSDRFIYESVLESHAGAADIILDFSRAQRDRIDLSTIDAITGTSRNDRFNFIGSSAFSGTAGELRFEQVNGDTHVQGDVNGDGVADLLIILRGTYTLEGNDFNL